VKVFHSMPQQDISKVGEAARWAEEMGYDGVSASENFSTPYAALILAAEHTSRVTLNTSIAVVFPMSPMTTAYTAWELQKFSKGRFVLGMGSQVKGHIERRFSVPWVAPGPRMKEYVLALRAIWDSFQNGTRLNFEGDYYSFKLLTPQFNPGPIDYPPPKISIAAVGPYMFRLAGEVCDGLLPHGFMSGKYMQEVGLPNLQKGLAKSGRTLKDIDVGGGGFFITGRTEEDLSTDYEETRRRISFYASTRTYKGIMDAHGWGDVCLELNRLSNEGQWDAMRSIVTDEMVDTFATIGTHDQIVDKMRDRYSSYATTIRFSIPTEGAEDDARVQNIVAGLQGI
jgi:probable F420-dependent oxidoreductase